MTTELISALTSAFVVGLLGAGHCFAMCGGILAALSLPGTNTTTGSKPNLIFLSLFYQLGRISSYSVIGVLAGLVGFQLNQLFSGVSALPLLRIFAGIMLILLGFYISGWWRVLTKLEQVGTLVWKRIEPIGRRFLPIDSYAKAIAVGMVWGWLPCGLVYSTLAVALAQSQPLSAGAVMASFGLGTLPAMWLGGALGASVASVIRAPWFRAMSGVLLIAFGVWTIHIAVLHSSHSSEQHSTHSSDSSEHQHPVGPQDHSEHHHH